MNEQPQSPMAGRQQPARADVLSSARLAVLDHPLSGHLLATIREAKSNPAEFGRAARLLATLLLWEACRTLPTRATSVTGFDGSEVRVDSIAEPPAGVSILRAGEVFSGPFRELFPEAALFHLGIRRDEATLRHDVYSDTLTAVPAARYLILDPMLATGGSVEVALRRVRSVFDGPVDVLSLVSAPLGVQVVLDADAEARIVTAALDEQLNDQGYILPGLGDAGDRFFGTPSNRD